jgi:type I restriction-modification system DNA methylase subunit
MAEAQARLPNFDRDIARVEKKLWESADQLRANSNLTAAEYSVPVLGLIFLRYADHNFAEARKELEGRARSGRRGVGKADYQARGVMYLPEEARFSSLFKLPEGANIGMAVNDAMRAVERENEELKDVLPKTYNRLEGATLVALLKNFSEIPVDLEGDVFGRIYEYFLGKFAMSEGQRGGEFFTPTSIVRLIVEIMEPYHGRILDPACGSTGSEDLMREHFPDGEYSDVPGLCKVATLEEIEAQGWSVNPGRYVGVAARAEEDFVFAERLEELNEELEALNTEARELEERIAQNVARLLDQQEDFELLADKLGDEWRGGDGPEYQTPLREESEDH